MTYLSRGAFLPICINYNSKNDKKLYVLIRNATKGVYLKFQNNKVDGSGCARLLREKRVQGRLRRRKVLRADRPRKESACSGYRRLKFYKPT